MDFFNDFIKPYWQYLVMAILTLLLMGSTIYIFISQKEPVSENPYKEIALETPEDERSETVFVDIKGAVKKAGVYEVESSSIINDVVKLAGGFTKKAYSNNINLSKKVNDEMVIYVYTKTEYNKLSSDEEKVTEQTAECVTTTYDICDCTEEGKSVITTTPSTDTTTPVTNDSTADTETKEEAAETTILKISINNASKEELMKLNGIGESKAESIIKYREENGGFKTLEDLKNVSGIGDAAYEKIKDSITL